MSRCHYYIEVEYWDNDGWHSFDWEWCYSLVQAKKAAKLAFKEYKKVTIQCFSGKEFGQGGYLQYKLKYNGKQFRRMK